MKINKLNWAKCPYCKVIINGYEFYPLNIFTTNELAFIQCPKCKKDLITDCKVTVTFKVGINK